MNHHGTDEDQSRSSQDPKGDAPEPSYLPTVVVRRRYRSPRPVDIPKPKSNGSPAPTVGSLAATEAEQIRQMEIKYAGTTPHGRQIIRMKLFTLKRALRQAENVVVQELATLGELWPQPISDALAGSGAKLIPDELGEQAAQTSRPHVGPPLTAIYPQRSRPLQVNKPWSSELVPHERRARLVRLGQILGPLFSCLAVT
jgi:hypothetical protein